MENIIKKVPIPICGLMLGVSALGNLLQSYSENVRYICGVLAVFLLILVILKLILCFEDVKKDMENPIMASVSGTFPMALMLLSVYAKSFIGQVAFYIWIFAILLHIALIIYFTIKFIFKLEIKKVFASYYIVYVGIVAASVTAPAYNQLKIGAICFWFGFVAFILLLILVSIRYIKYKEIPEPAKPLICIYGAPMSLCIAGYIQSVNPKAFIFLVVMLIVSTILYIFALAQLIKYIKLQFYPSFASFTFPFVITAIALKQAMVCFNNLGHPMPYLQYVVLIETVIAVILVIFVYVSFIKFIFVNKKS